MEKANKDLTTLDNGCGRNLIAIRLSLDVPKLPAIVSITYLSTVLTGGPGQSRLCTDAIGKEREETVQVS